MIFYKRYLIGQAQRGNPDLWGMKPDYMNRLTGKPKYPDQEFNCITAFYWSGENTPEAIRSTATVIAETIAENELDLAYIERNAVAPRSKGTENFRFPVPAYYKKSRKYRIIDLKI